MCATLLPTLAILINTMNKLAKVFEAGWPCFCGSVSMLRVFVFWQLLECAVAKQLQIGLEGAEDI